MAKSKEFLERQGQFKNKTKEELQELQAKGVEQRKKNQEESEQKEWERINFQQVLSVMLLSPLAVKSESYKTIKGLGVKDPLLIHWYLYILVHKGNPQTLEKFIDLVGEQTDIEAENYELPSSFVDSQYSYIDKHIVPNKSYIFVGGRGSLKSTYISGKIIELIKQNPMLNACAIRQYQTTLKDSVYAQFEKTISILGLNDEFEFTKQPMEITYKKTGQKIYFRGADKPEKLKGITCKVGYIGILWKEEKDQFRGAEAERSIGQSLARGGSYIYDFSSFNPPISTTHWCNQQVALADDDMVIHHSCYKDIDCPEWLGEKFFKDAERLKQTNEKAYLHEYEGIPVGNGDNVFENVNVRDITEEELNSFDYIYMGIDWGFYPDPFRWVKVGYRDETVYILDEYSANKTSNQEVWDELVEQKGVTNVDYITADSSEPKSVNDLRSYGANIRSAIKGQGSVHEGIKWLQTRKEIVINSKCKHTAKEFINYEYEKTKDGEPISAYPDKDNHSIDAVRYALERVWRKRGN